MKRINALATALKEIEKWRKGRDDATPPQGYFNTPWGEKHLYVQRLHKITLRASIKIIRKLPVDRAVIELMYRDRADVIPEYLHEKAVFHANLSCFMDPDDDPEEVAVYKEYLGWYKAVRKQLEINKLEWIWTIGLYYGLNKPLKEGRVSYPTEITQVPDEQSWKGLSSISDLATLWLREKDKLSTNARLFAEKKLNMSLTGKKILKNGVTVGEMYTIDEEGIPCFLGEDGKTYTPVDAANMVAEARPWTRVEIMTQFRNHAEVDEVAGAFYNAVASLVGPMGQGGLEYGRVSASDLNNVRQQLPLLVQWIAAQLKVEVPAFLPEVKPMTDDVRYAVGRVDVMGVHHESENAIYLQDASKETVVHELVHWTLTVTGLRKGMTFEEEERFVDSIVKKLP